MPPAYLPPISTYFHSHGPQPPRWDDIKACETQSGTSLTAKHPSQSVASKVASGGPGKRDAGRMSYRRRLELAGSEEWQCRRC
ncbi:hypothetical protein LENED_002168 [Lentinula edodes]|uniref:Uncharacterized protein n=1 Tax=Lentinula edodes TaxID=5353 RepID=A0A1Q3E041_LENED|nr:hypothetical protein LENED_002168 [Lentinula edodes]